MRSPKSETGPRTVLAIDVGASKIASALVGADGQVLLRSGRYPHANAGPRSVVATVLSSARSCLASGEWRPQAIGIGVAAQVDTSTGTVLYAPNLGWRDYPLGPTIAEEFHLPVLVVNDARAATVAEWRLGAGRGWKDLFCLSLGTGVGGSAVIGGRLAEGTRYAAGEVGHMTILAGGRRCHCPNRGCLEAYVGGWAIAERAQEAATQSERAGGPMVELAGSAKNITARTVFDAARAGDPLANRIVQETESYLADGAVGIVNAFNPARLLLAGGVITGWPGMVRVVHEAVQSRCQPPAARAEVVAAQFGEEAPLIGAAVAAFERSGVFPGTSHGPESARPHTS
ncbi:MAG: ROK family protein [Thermoplasmata archaeon]